MVLKNQDDNRGRRYQSDSGRYGYGYSAWNDREAEDRAGSMVDQVKDKAGQVGEAVGGAVDSVKEKAGQVTSQVRDRAGELRSKAGGTIMRTLQENPLPVGMVALGIGAAVGLLVPETDRENQLMGSARDKFMERAQDTAQDLKEKVQTVAGQTFDAAKETAQHVARDLGLAPYNAWDGAAAR
jgi:gas vesicle protein